MINDLSRGTNSKLVGPSAIEDGDKSPPNSERSADFKEVCREENRENNKERTPQQYSHVASFNVLRQQKACTRKSGEATNREKTVSEGREDGRKTKSRGKRTNRRDADKCRYELQSQKKDQTDSGIMKKNQQIGETGLESRSDQLKSDSQPQPSHPEHTRGAGFL